jgi:hypothetical protein
MIFKTLTNGKGLEDYFFLNPFLPALLILVNAAFVFELAPESLPGFAPFVLRARAAGLPPIAIGFYSLIVSDRV